jgi:hypothetical protein
MEGRRRDALEREQKKKPLDLSAIKRKKEVVQRVNKEKQT